MTGADGMFHDSPRWTSSCTRVGIFVFVFGLLACAGGAQQGKHVGRHEDSPLVLCNASPAQRHKHAAAMYDGARWSDDKGLGDFIKEWQRDVEADDAARFEPTRMVRSSLEQVSIGKGTVDISSHSYVG